MRYIYDKWLTCSQNICRDWTCSFILDLNKGHNPLHIFSYFKPRQTVICLHYDIEKTVIGMHYDIEKTI